jgi:hypothetical protein
MTPSSTPGSPSPDDPMPWSDSGPHTPADATRPIRPAADRYDDTAPQDRVRPAGPRPPRGEEPGRYDDDQHTVPLPAVPTHDLPPEEPYRPADPPEGPAGRYGDPSGNRDGDRIDSRSHDPYDHGFGGGATAVAPGRETPGPGAPDPAQRHARQEEEFGGLQLIPGFFGWLSALALTWLLLAAAGLAASALNLRLDEGLGGVVDELAAGSTAAWTGAAVLGAVELVAFLGGGYAAGRMARFSGAGQGVSVWLWSLFGRSVATVAGLVWADTIGLAPVGVSAQALIGDLLVPGLLTLAAVLLLDLLGAVLGGLWGTRYHRRVDRWGDTGR